MKPERDKRGKHGVGRRKCLSAKFSARTKGTKGACLLPVTRKKKGTQIGERDGCYPPWGKGWVRKEGKKKKKKVLRGT